MKNLYLWQHPQVLTNLVFGQKWATDAELRDAIYRRFKLYLLAIPNIELTAEHLQTVADFIKDKYNHLYDTTQYKYNPIENYHSTEIITDTRRVNSDKSGKSSQFPMDSNRERDVVQNKEGSSEVEVFEHTLHRSGNIGVTTSQQMIQSERDMIISVKEMYVNEFTDYFMINTWGYSDER